MDIATEAPVVYRSSAARPDPVTLIATAILDIVSRRRLIRYLIRADVKKKGADTVLGNLWWILDPLMATLVYVIVMTLIFQRSTPDFPVFLLAALIPFKWFTATVGDSTSSVVKNERLIKQIQFPKIVLPIAGAGAEVVNFLFGLVVLLTIVIILPFLPLDPPFGAHASPMLLWIPVIAFVQFVFSLGFVLLLSAVTVFYRDIGIFIGHLMRLMFFLSPILWSFDATSAGRGASLKEAFGPLGFELLHLNPLAILTTAYRHVIYGVVTTAPDGKTLTWTAPIPPDLVLLGIVLAVGIALCALGAWVFKRLEPAFAKVL
jgi:lipopolysaccharide transport system permease protein/teichoic acid transport system permease protein